MVQHSRFELALRCPLHRASASFEHLAHDTAVAPPTSDLRPYATEMERITEPNEKPAPRQQTFEELFNPKFFQRLSSVAPADGPSQCQGAAEKPLDPIFGLPSDQFTSTEIPNLQSIEDFDRERELKMTNPTLVALQPKAVLDQAVSTRFNHLCQIGGVRPEFDIREFTKGRFTVHVVLAGHVVQCKEVFGSKKDARIGLTELALPVLESLDLEHSKKRKRQEAEEMREGNCNRKVTKEKLDCEGWISILNEFTQKKGLPAPEFEYFCTTEMPYQFCCTCRLVNRPRVFGSKDDRYPAKNEAKKAASRDAVLYLRSFEGLDSTSATPSPAAQTKRTKIIELRAVTTDRGYTGLTPSLENVDINDPKAERVSMSMPQQVHALSVALGLSPPQYKSQSSTLPTGPDGSSVASFTLVSMAAYFTEDDVKKQPRLAGPLGGAVNVCGQKKARDMCSREVLRLLKEIQQGREAS